MFECEASRRIDKRFARAANHSSAGLIDELSECGGAMQAQVGDRGYFGNVFFRVLSSIDHCIKLAPITSPKQMKNVRALGPTVRCNLSSTERFRLLGF